MVEEGISWSVMSDVPPAKRSVHLDVKIDSDTLVLFFSGLHNPVVINGFNYLTLTNDWPIKKIYIRDVYNLWYHSHYDGIGEGVKGLTTWLSNRIEELNPQKVYTIGGSMGGYGAILFGALLQVDHVLVFGPQTCMSLLWRYFHIDHRSWRRKRHIYKAETRNRNYFSLYRVLKEHNPNLPVDLHIGRDRLDRAHAKHIRECEGVKVTDHSTSRHDLSRVLRQRGELLKIVRSFIKLP